MSDEREKMKVCLQDFVNIYFQYKCMITDYKVTRETVAEEFKVIVEVMQDAYNSNVKLQTRFKNLLPYFKHNIKIYQNLIDSLTIYK